ncbi:hypothetical protein GIB67_012838 [Kingdonia uniflora]|uniref:Complex III subunit 9 n=1 Tax=Kingdonia uniflora TaxID=39325 RepID=A0A7J7NFD9_9MAGN|nr:hypothetical protein GIB67_012838 [Kingdonia uniflora]
METTTMARARRSRGGGMLEGLYKVLMRRNSVYVTFILVGAFAGERAVDYGIHKLWEQNNVGMFLGGIIENNGTTRKFRHPYF